jgi:hypothetical protein
MPIRFYMQGLDGWWDAHTHMLMFMSLQLHVQYTVLIRY